MPSFEAALVDEIRLSYQDHPGYRHWFWDWFAEAELNIDDLRKFSLIYYEHVKRFRPYIAGALTISPTEQLQVAFAHILADEYGIHIAGRAANDSHPEMFRKFMKSLGLESQDWSTGTPIPGITHFHDTHFAMFQGRLLSEGLGAVIFGMETTTPFRHGKVLTGLEKFTERTHIPVDATFFSQHIDVDQHHSSLLHEEALELITADPKGFARGARYSFDARQVFLDDLGARLKA